MNKVKPKGKYLVVIVGPTAVGKTELGIRLARHYHSVIISADSRQFYEELNIGTAKPSDLQLAQVKHFFIGTKKITELYGAGHFEKDVMVLLKELFSKRDIVFMVGGSGLYIDAVLNGVDDFEAVPEAIRQELNSEFALKGLPWLQSEVEKYDPDYYSQVDKKNPQRLIRALEVIKHTGQAYSSFLKKNQVLRDFTAIKIFINTNRELLYERINKRVDNMIEEGLLEEVNRLNAFKQFNALKTVGYKELNEHLDGKYDLKTAIENIKQHTRNYAKRQITWFKNKDSFEEFLPEEFEKMVAYIDIIIEHG